MAKRKTRKLHETLLFCIEYFLEQLIQPYSSSSYCSICTEDYHPSPYRVYDLLWLLIELRQMFNPDQIKEIQKRLKELAGKYKFLDDILNGVGERMNEWITLEKLEPGAVFETKDGILAVKSGYFHSDEPEAQSQCISLESGEYVYFPDKNSTLVKWFR